MTGWPVRPCFSFSSSFSLTRRKINFVAPPSLPRRLHLFLSPSPPRSPTSSSHLPIPFLLPLLTSFSASSYFSHSSSTYLSLSHTLSLLSLFRRHMRARADRRIFFIRNFLLPLFFFSPQSLYPLSLSLFSLPLSFSFLSSCDITTAASRERRLFPFSPILSTVPIFQSFAHLFLSFFPLLLSLLLSPLTHSACGSISRALEKPRRYLFLSPLNFSLLLRMLPSTLSLACAHPSLLCCRTSCASFFISHTREAEKRERGRTKKRERREMLYLRVLLG